MYESLLELKLVLILSLEWNGSGKRPEESTLILVRLVFHRQEPRKETEGLDPLKAEQRMT